MQEVSQIIAVVLNRNKYMVYILLFPLIVISLFAVISIKTQNGFIGIAGVMIALLPIAFMKHLLTLCKKNIVIHFYDDHFSLTLSNVQNEREEFCKSCLYTDIESCAIESTSDKFSTITIRFLNDKKLNYVLTSKDDSIKNISESIFKSIKLRRKDVPLAPTLFVSKAGTYLIIGVGILISVSIALHIFWAPETSFFSLIIGISLFVRILLKRKDDINTLKRLNAE